jgi:Flp pilus assembly protein TadD
MGLLKLKGSDGTAARLAKEAAALVLVCSAFAIPRVTAQTRGHTTVRHHRVEDQNPTADKLNSAEQSLAKQDYATAEPLLKEVVAEKPDDYAAWYDLGFLYHALGRDDDAIEAYKKSVQAKPSVFESNLNLGLGLAAAEKPEAERYLRAATKLNPASHPEQQRKRAWLALGHFLETRDPQEAVTAFQQAAAVDPKDPEPHLLAGAALEKLKNPEAEQEYQLALSLNPNSTDAMTALTNFYMAQRRFADAENLLRKLVVIHPDDAGAHIQLGRMLAIAGKSEDAATELQTGLKLDPRDENAQRDLAQVYTDLHKFSDAQGIYVALLSKSPNDAGLHSMLGGALLQQKKFAEAESELMKAVQLKPDAGETYGQLALAANENKQYPTVIQALDLRAKLLPENPMTYFLRATAYDHLRDAKQASRYYHEFLNIAGGKYPDQEWQATHRLITIEPKK